jgi:hypothetical protein
VEILTSKIRHENGDKFKNGLSKKGVEYFYLSNDTNKSIANFRETIPLMLQHISKVDGKWRSQRRILFSKSQSRITLKH